jgi:hypothetical protein
MSAKTRQRTLMENLILPADQQGQDPTVGTGITSANQPLMIRRERITLASYLAAITAALDYSSHELLTFANSNVIILGTVVNVVGVPDGVGVTTIANVDIAVGSVATTSTDFSGAGEDDMVEKIDLTAGGVGQGDSLDNATPALLWVGAGASNKVFLNQAVTIGADGSVTYTGYIDVFYADLGVAS